MLIEMYLMPPPTPCTVENADAYASAPSVMTRCEMLSRMPPYMFWAVRHAVLPLYACQCSQYNRTGSPLLGFRLSTMMVLQPNLHN